MKLVVALLSCAVIVMAFLLWINKLVAMAALAYIKANKITLPTAKQLRAWVRWYIERRFSRKRKHFVEESSCDPFGNAFHNA